MRPAANKKPLQAFSTKDLTSFSDKFSADFSDMFSLDFDEGTAIDETCAHIHLVDINDEDTVAAHKHENPVTGAADGAMFEIFSEVFADDLHVAAQPIMRKGERDKAGSIQDTHPLPNQSITPSNSMGNLDDKQVIDYLRQHPDLFCHHPEVLLIMKVPTATGSALSLYEKQREVLQARIKTVEDKYRHLLIHADESQKLLDNIHRLSCNVAQSPNLSDAIACLNTQCQARLQLKPILWLWDDDMDLDASATFKNLARPSSAVVDFAHAHDLPQIIYGDYPAWLQEWLTEETQSVICFPLRKTKYQHKQRIETVGLLAFISPRPFVAEPSPNIATVTKGKKTGQKSFEIFDVADVSVDDQTKQAQTDAYDNVFLAQFGDLMARMLEGRLALLHQNRPTHPDFKPFANAIAQAPKIFSLPPRRP